MRLLRPARPSLSTWLTGTWHPDGTDVLVKVNATRRERFWMSAASQGAPGSVPHVFASDDVLGRVDASWLVLERLPYTYDPGWGAAAFSSLLAAAARFQVFAGVVDTDLVFDEDVETIRRFALGGQGLCPEAATVVSHLDRDWAWVGAMAPRFAARKAGRSVRLMRSTGCRHCFAGGSHSRSGSCSRTGMLIPPSGHGWPGTCRPPRISTGYVRCCYVT